MAKNSKYIQPFPKGAYRPTDEDPRDRVLMVPGIVYPLVVPEGGYEGSRAVCEYRTMAEGRIVEFDYDADGDGRAKFRNYGEEYIIADGTEWEAESGERSVRGPMEHDKRASLESDDDKGDKAPGINRGKPRRKK